MRVDSAAGEFGFNVKDIELRSEGLVLIGQMGVWEAETLMRPSDIRKLLGLVLKQPGAWGFLIRQLIASDKR